MTILPSHPLLILILAIPVVCLQTWLLPQLFVLIWNLLLMLLDDEIDLVMVFKLLLLLFSFIDEPGELVFMLHQWEGVHFWRLLLLMVEGHLIGVEGGADGFGVGEGDG